VRASKNSCDRISRRSISSASWLWKISMRCVTRPYNRHYLFLTRRYCRIRYSSPWSVIPPQLISWRTGLRSYLKKSSRIKERCLLRNLVFNILSWNSTISSYSTNLPITRNNTIVLTITNWLPRLNELKHHKQSDGKSSRYFKLNYSLNLWFPSSSNMSVQILHWLLRLHSYRKTTLPYGLSCENSVNKLMRHLGWRRTSLSWSSSI
jgi:hypothetical protein